MSGMRSNLSNTILFEEGDWRLYGHSDDEYSSMAHRCPKVGKGAEWYWFWWRSRCPRCVQHIPENVIGLWTLHNWDRP